MSRSQCSLTAQCIDVRNVGPNYLFSFLLDAYLTRIGPSFCSLLVRPHVSSRETRRKAYDSQIISISSQLVIMLLSIAVVDTIDVLMYGSDCHQTVINTKLD